MPDMSDYKTQGGKMRQQKVAAGDKKGREFMTENP